MKFYVTDHMRLDKALVLMMDLSRAKIQTLISQGCVAVNTRVIRDKSYNVLHGDEVVVHRHEDPIIKIEPSCISFDVIYEDDNVAVINKPAGLVVHPGISHSHDTLVNGLLYRYGEKLSAISGIRPGIVHRLDKDTSGIMIIAKDDMSQISLANQIQNKQMRRFYYAIIWGIPKKGSGVIETCVSRDSRDKSRMAVTSSGKLAITHYSVLKIIGCMSFVECEIMTGRTHQIRLHMSYMGHSVVGDQVYGHNARKALRFNVHGIERQALHAYKLIFDHPATKERMEFCCPLPHDMQQILMPTA